MSSVNPAERLFAESGFVARYIGNIGWGAFAGKDFEEGEVVFRIPIKNDPRYRLIPWIESFGDCHERSYTVAPDYSICTTPESPFWYVNHSCAANAGFVNWGRFEADGTIPVIALRRIGKGEQITMDYAVFTTSYDGTPEGGEWYMENCLCGSPDCRGQVRALKYLPFEMQMAALFPDGVVRGQIVAHMLAEVPHLVDTLRERDPEQYKNFEFSLKQLSEDFPRLFPLP